MFKRLNTLVEDSTFFPYAAGALVLVVLALPFVFQQMGWAKRPDRRP